MLGDDLEAWLAESNLMKRTFRNAAIIAGLIERRWPGKEKTGRQVTVNSDLIYDVLRSHQPDHVLLQAAWEDAADGLIDVHRLGALLKRIEMNFLPDVYVLCDVCRGARYNRETMSVKYKGKSIADLLDTTVEEALPLLENIPQINQKLQTLLDVGLGYIKLGQSATTLSGGEAQRIKLAKELSKRATGRTVYILDEPTTGLHFADVHKLLDVLQRLVALGNSVLVIEHNLDVIKSADYIIDLGPEGGENGGRVVASGTPEEVARVRRSHTGQVLKPLLNGRVTSSGHGVHREDKKIA